MHYYTVSISNNTNIALVLVLASKYIASTSIALVIVFASKYIASTNSASTIFLLSRINKTRLMCASFANKFRVILSKRSCDNCFSYFAPKL